MKRILLIRFGSIGDVVLTTPAIRAVRKTFPEAYIAMVVGDRSADIVSENPHLDEIIIFHRDVKSIWSFGKVPLNFWKKLNQNFAQAFFKSLTEIKRVAHLIREREFDVSIDMQRKLRPSLLAYLGRVKFRIGYHQPGGLLCDVKMPDRENIHAVDRNLALLEPLGILKADRELEMFLAQEDRDYAARALESYGLSSKSPIIGIFPGASWRPRCWPPERFAAVGDLAAKQYNAGVIIFSGPGEEDIADSVAQNMNATPVLIKERMTLRQLGAMIERCHLFLSNDTGPMHISVGVKTPTVCLFGPGNHIKFQPIGERHAFIKKDISCSPCKQFTDRCKDNICMKSITVDEVWEALSRRLR